MEANVLPWVLQVSDTMRLFLRRRLVYRGLPSGSGTTPRGDFSWPTTRVSISLHMLTWSHHVGGYTQGGGHSALSTSFGLAADNVLSWEVVTADGIFLEASQTENPDLFWALNGGGGSTFGVVASMTVKAFPDAIMAGATLSYYMESNPIESFYGAIQAFHEALPAMVDAGSMVVYYFTNDFFMISPLNAYNKTKGEVETILRPYVSELDSLDINYTVAYSQFDSYYEHYDHYFGPLPLGNIQVGIAQYGARLIPRSVAANISTTWRSVVEQGVTWIGVGIDVSSFGNSETTSVHPAWRDALVHSTFTLPWNFTAPWEDMIAVQDKMTEKIMPEIEAATAGSGSYGTYNLSSKLKSFTAW